MGERGRKRRTKGQREAAIRRKRRTKIMVRVSNESASTHHRWEETPFTMTDVDIEKRSTASRWISRPKPQFYYSSI